MSEYPWGGWRAQKKGKVLMKDISWMEGFCVALRLCEQIRSTRLEGIRDANTAVD